jgi:hypothetical protein
VRDCKNRPDFAVCCYELGGKFDLKSTVTKTTPTNN